MTINRLLDKTIYPVMPTPLLDDQRIDFSGLDACVQFYRGAGVTGITVLGSGGELPYFSDAEQFSIVKRARQAAGSQTLLIAGLNAYSARQAIDKIDALQGQADVLLLLLNDYYAASFADYQQALAEIAAQAPLPLLFYYFPQVTGRYFKAEQLLQLLKIPNIVGIKDSSVHLPTAIKLLKGAPTSLYFSGLSLLLEKLIPLQPCGAICPIAALLPQQTQAYQQALLHGEQKTAQRLGQVLQQMFPIINKPKLSATLQCRALAILSRSPVPLLRKVSSPHANSKEALRQLGVPIQATVRTPLPKLLVTDRQHIQAHLQSAGALGRSPQVI